MSLLARMHARWAALESRRGDDCWAIGWHEAAADRWRRAGRRYQRALDAAASAHVSPRSVATHEVLAAAEATC